MTTEEAFKRDLASVLNKHGYDNYANTPDYILAEFLNEMFYVYNRATKSREAGFGKSLRLRTKKAKPAT